MVGFRRTKEKERASSALVAFATDSASVPEPCRGTYSGFSFRDGWNGLDRTIQGLIKHWMQ